jgi:autotransporter-associated beta strand protein
MKSTYFILAFVLTLMGSAARADTLTVFAAASLTKSGAGTLSLSGTNTFTGGTTITAGTLRVGLGGTTGSLPGSVSNSGALVFNRSNALTQSGNISGTG